MDVGDGPGPLEGANTRIIMPFIIAGDNEKGLRVALDDGSAVITPNHIHINRINGMMTATPTGLSSSEITAKCAEGQIKATVNLDWKTPTQGPPVSLSYDGDAEVKQIDLHQLAMEYTTDPSVRQQAFGQLDLNVKYQGSILQNSPATRHRFDRRPLRCPRRYGYHTRPFHRHPHPARSADCHEQPRAAQPSARRRRHLISPIRWSRSITPAPVRR